MALPQLRVESVSELWRQQQLPEIVASLAAKPGHEAVRTMVTDILRHAFGADYVAIDHEVRMPEVHGRADMLFGATVLEFKRDLGRELDDVHRQLPTYLAERERRTGRRYLGIATDGATFLAFALHGEQLAEIARHETDPRKPQELLSWLEAALSDRDDLAPDPQRIRDVLGRGSLTYGRARDDLAAAWDALRNDPEVLVKKGLWDGLLRQAYGAEVGDASLFLQHTYLTIVAKTLAIRVLDLPATDAAAILSGQPLARDGIQGAVESDFFDWVLRAPGGPDLVQRIARQVARFRLREVETDVLKVLYESLIDPEQRHDLGEYYTPDWLAAKLVRRVLDDPLRQRVLDPACGSGTFLFHVLRRVISAGRDAGMSDAELLRLAAANVRGIDVHPVAVIIARVTRLVAAAEILPAREGDLHVPVYLGDSMQWNLVLLGDSREVMVPVPGEGPLYVPASFAEDQSRFEAALRELTDGLAAVPMTPTDTVRSALRRLDGAASRDVEQLADTYERLRRLNNAGRNDIWPFVLRNVVRPIWLSRPDQQADLVIGNPPWIAYRHLSAEMQTKLREASTAYGLWVGRQLATQQDMAAAFWARAAERYLKRGGVIAFVMPYAALNRPAFRGLRDGGLGGASVRIEEAWNLAEVRPLFPTSAAVLIARRGALGPLPDTVVRFTGFLPRRDAAEATADADLRRETAPWPPIATGDRGSPYRERFRQGATIVPRRFFLVELQRSGRLGSSRGAPRVIGRTGPLDKRPWTEVPPPEGPVEQQFLRPLILGETVAPFRLLEPALAVIPADGATVLDSAAAQAAGYRHLAAWLRDAEAKWVAHCSKKGDGTPRMSLLAQIDHMRKLSIQLRNPGPRVAYIASGTLISAAIVLQEGAIIEHAGYWAPISSISEGNFLCSVINSDVALQATIPLQPRGWRDPRHFDKLIWELPIPEFDPAIELHREIAALGAEAEATAAAVPLPSGDFRRKRRAIRDALRDAGIAARIEALVARLLA